MFTTILLWKLISVFKNNAGDTIDGGKLVIDVYIWGIHVHSEKHVCGEDFVYIISG